MNSLETELTAELQNTQGVTVPPSAVDVGQARALGRARRRRRRAAAATGLTGGCLAAALVALSVTGAYSKAQTTPDADATFGSGASASVDAAATLVGTDPLRATIGYGWLPDGVRITGFEGDAFNDGTGAALLTAAGGSTTLSLTVLHAGRALPQPHLKGGAPQALTAAPKVDGHTAFWTDVPGSGEATADGVVELRWQYAPDSWAQLDATIDGSTSSSVTATVYRVAENVEYAMQTSLAMPFHVAQQPAGLPAIAASWQAGSADGQIGWTARIAFQSKATDGATAQQQLLILVMPTTAGSATSSRVSSSAAQPGETTEQTSIDGRKAQIVTGNGFVELRVPAVNGLTVIVEARGTTAIAAVGGTAGIAAYFRTLTILGSDPANWTTAVVG